MALAEQAHDVMAAADGLTDSFRSATWGPLVALSEGLAAEWHQGAPGRAPSGNAALADGQKAKGKIVFEPEKNPLFFFFSPSLKLLPPLLFHPIFFFFF